MVKKIKDKRKDVSNIMLNGKKKYDKKKDTYKRKLQEKKHKNEDKPSIVTNRNIQFKNKQKGKLAKKKKHIQKHEQNPIASTIVNPKMTKITNAKKLAQTKKSDLHLQNEKKPQCNLVKQKSNKKYLKRKNQICTQFNGKFNNNNNNNGSIQKEEKSGNPKHKLKQKKKLDNKLEKLNSLLKKKKKQEEDKISSGHREKNINFKSSTSGHNLNIKRLQELLLIKGKEKRKEKEYLKPQSLRERMMTKLKASRFRYLNETLYNNESSESKKYFKNDPDAFKAYHEGYKQQVEQWPLNPLDIIISSIEKMQKEFIIADFGCGDARLAASVPHKVHSFDLVSLNESVTVCDVAHTPLLTNGVNVVVFCLSLMGTNLQDYIMEANRILKLDGILKIAEVESRFEKVEDFIESMSAYGFKNTWKDLSHNLFYFLDFKKENNINTKKDKLPPITLKPCLYKKR